MLRVLWNYSDVFLQLKKNRKHIYNIIIRLKLKPLKCFRNSRKSTWFLALSCHSDFAHNVPPEISLESLLWVPRHFWGYVECFKSSRNRLGCFSKLFENFQMPFLKHLKNLSSTSNEICGNFYLGAVLRHGEASKPPKNCFACSECPEIILRCFFNSKRTGNIFTTSSYD